MRITTEMISLTLLKSKSDICYSFFIHDCSSTAQEMNLYRYAAYYRGEQQIRVLY